MFWAKKLKQLRKIIFPRIFPFKSHRISDINNLLMHSSNISEAST